MAFFFKTRHLHRDFAGVYTENPYLGIHTGGMYCIAPEHILFLAILLYNDCDGIFQWTEISLRRSYIEVPMNTENYRIELNGRGLNSTSPP